jgi:hypothetical protein
MWKVCKLGGTWGGDHLTAEISTSYRCENQSMYVLKVWSPPFTADLWLFVLGGKLRVWTTKNEFLYQGLPVNWRTNWSIAAGIRVEILKRWTDWCGMSFKLNIWTSHTSFGNKIRTPQFCWCWHDARCFFSGVVLGNISLPLQYSSNKLWRISYVTTSPLQMSRKQTMTPSLKT